MNVDNTKQLKTIVSFCTGYGGIERGLELAGVELRHLAYVEIEAFAVANLVAKMETGEMVPTPLWSDLKTFPSKIFRGRVDILTGGYPCQPFSSAGKRAGQDDPRHLWPYIRNHVETIRPVRCFFENVEGHISLGLREVIEDLESLGYTTTWGIFSAAEVGAPHQRKRVYILADSDNQRESQPQGVEQNVGRRTEHSSKNMADADSVRHDGRPVSDEIRERSLQVEAQRRSEFSRLRGETERRGDELAYANSPRQQQSNKEDAGRSSKQPDGGGLRSRAISDTDSERLEGGIYRSVVDTEGRQKQEIRRTAECSDWGSRDGHQGWASEPGLGRVVNGSTHRVDRLRLLGNGVVPQTAAKAWEVLGGEING